VKPASPPSSRYRVQAVAKALELLAAFGQDRPVMSLAELAGAAGIPRPTAFRLLSTLEEGGFVRRVGSDWGVGFRCFVLGNVFEADLDLRREALPFLEALRDATGETTQLALLNNWQVVYLARVHSRRPVAYMRSRAGAVLPSYCTGLGKALLAALPPDEVAEWSRTQDLVALTPNTITTSEQLLRELDRVRERGYALDAEERELGVRCVSAVVRGAGGAAIGAISVAGPSERMPAELESSELVAQVVASAAAISEQMGYVAGAEGRRAQG
jgi:IclR family transcriptional regulator, KDG regulon repressor